MNEITVGAVYWRTYTPDTDDVCMVTLQDGKSRWVLPECYYSQRSRCWFHKIVDTHDEQVDDPEIGSVKVFEAWEKLDCEVVAWADYPDPYGVTYED